jgi:hypothetical protein
VRTLRLQLNATRTTQVECSINNRHVDDRKSRNQSGDQDYEEKILENSVAEQPMSLNIDKTGI